MPLRVGRAAPADVLAQYKALGPTFELSYLVVILASLLFYGMIVLNTAAVSRGEQPAFGASFALALRRTPALLGASIVFVIAVITGFCLLIVPGFYVWNRLQLYVVPLLVEPAGAMASLGSSWRVVGGHWWRTATVVSVLFVILFVLEIVLGLFSGAFAVFGGGGIITDPSRMVVRVAVASLLIGIVVRTFTVPLVFAAFVALYQDLLLRRSGGDLEARLGALSRG